MDNDPSRAGGFRIEDSMNLRHYWHVVLERRWLVVAVFVVVFALSAIYAFKSTPIFQAVARMEIAKESDNVLNLDGMGVEGRDQDYLVTQYKKLQSRTLIEAVISKLNLDKDERYAQALDKVSAVMEDYTIAPVRLSRLVEVKAEHPNPKVAMDMANTLVDIFIQQNLDQRIKKSVDAWKWLKVEAETLEKNVKEADDAVHKFRETKRMISLTESENVVVQSLKQAKARLDEAVGTAASAQKIWDEVKSQAEQGKSLDSIPQVAQSPIIQQIRKELADREAYLAGLLKRYKDKWPEVVQTREQIAERRKSLEVESKRIYDSIRLQVAQERAKEASARAEFEKAEKETYALGALRGEYDALTRKAESSKELYNLVLTKMKETDLTSKDRMQNMMINDEADLPLQPIKPKKTLILLFGMVVGMGAALGLAFFINYLDDSIKSQDDVETYLRLPFLGYVPNIKTNSVVERDLQAHLHPQSNAAEGFRTVRAAISLVHRSDKFRVVSVSSTIPSEGKSLVASNLAIVNAQSGLRTLLVDADLRRPSVHKAFQLQSPIGLSSYLNEKVNSVDEFIHTTEVPNLDVVCCGAVPNSPSELVGSKRMQQFLQEVRGRYDRVVLDCPPISAVSDPLVIASMSDGIIFVTKFNKIRREHARKSVQRIQDAGIHILGCVLNDIDFEGKDSYYYSYYYYQNRYYSSHYKSDKSEMAEESAKGPKKS